MNTPCMGGEGFADALLGWYDVHGRRDLPWQKPRSPYRTWLSEVMLQQTQVRTVIPYFERFIAALPTLVALAAAPEDEVLALWSGLGYYSRARNLHSAARLCIARHGGELPRDFDQLAALPGIGRSTAAAILAQAHGERHAILDGNVRRVLARVHGVRGWPGNAATQRQLWQLAEMNTPARRVADYTQAVMDLGATLCLRARPACARCPVQACCTAHREGTTALLPERKPRRALPRRSIAMLVVRDGGGRVLLERRPAGGVWAGLWSLPESEGLADAGGRLLAHYAIAAGEPRALAPFAHTFSHYHLEVAPLVFDDAVPARRVADQPHLRWADVAQLQAIGLPAPVRRLLATLEDEP